MSPPARPPAPARPAAPPAPAPGAARGRVSGGGTPLAAAPGQIDDFLVTHPNLPNLVAVNFFLTGGLMRAVDALNRVPGTDTP